MYIGAYDSWESHSQTVSFLGVEFPYGKIQMPGSYLYDTIGDPIPLAEIKEISEPTLNEEYDMPDISHLKDGFEIPFEVKMKKSAINKLFQPCFGREPYRNLEKCAKCILKKDCVVAKIENNFNMRLRAYHP